MGPRSGIGRPSGHYWLSQLLSCSTRGSTNTPRRSNPPKTAGMVEPSSTKAIGRQNAHTCANNQTIQSVIFGMLGTCIWQLITRRFSGPPEPH